MWKTFDAEGLKQVWSLPRPPRKGAVVAWDGDDYQLAFVLKTRKRQRFYVFRQEQEKEEVA